MTKAAELYEQAFAAHRQGRLDEAIAVYEEAIRMAPDHADALHMLGVARMQKGDPSAGASLIERAIRVRPGDARAHSNLASALIAASRFDEAIESAGRAVELAPDSVDAWGNLATALSRRSRFTEAVAPLQRAISLAPERAGLHSALGTALGMLGRFDEALDCHRKAIERAPDRPQYRNNMAGTMSRAGLKGEAADVLRTIVEQGSTDPDYFVFLARLLKQQGRMAESTSVLEQITDEHARQVVGRQLTFQGNYVDSTTPAIQLELARDAAARTTAGIAPLPPAQGDRTPGRRLKVGLVSSDFREHAVALFLLGVVSALDREQLELFAYSGNDSGDGVNRAFRQLVPNWRGTSSVTDKELAEQIRRDRIDVLIDLSGPTTARLGVFAFRPAPVAAIWLGYSGTTGLDAINHIIGDDEVLPAGIVQSVEDPVRLPDAYLCFQPTEPPPPVAPLPAATNGFVTFGSFNNLNKVSEATMDAWAAVLAAVPNSRMVLKAHQASMGAGDTIVDGLVRRGVVADRIDMLGWAPAWCEHLPLYGQFDIGLDPFPYNGTTTTCESLMMGVPVVTLRGDRFISRVGATLMHTAGLDDWIADNAEDYVRLAVQKAQSLNDLAILRAGLREQFLASPLCDTRRFARNFEAALRGMWERYCAS